MGAWLLTINGGSSSLKFAAFRTAPALTRVRTGTFERIGQADAQLTAVDPAGGRREQRRVSLPDHAACVPILIEVLRSMDAPGAIGHRVVHGGTRHRAPERVTTELLADLRTLAPFAPEHEPAEIALMEAFARHYPDVPQVACFDTAFHADLPRVAADCCRSRAATPSAASAATASTASRTRICCRSWRGWRDPAAAQRPRRASPISATAPAWRQCATAAASTRRWRSRRPPAW